KRQISTKVKWGFECGSGPGGRRFKSSLPDQSFQSVTIHFWSAALTDVGEIEAAKASKVHSWAQFKLKSIEEKKNHEFLKLHKDSLDIEVGTHAECAGA
ncbi:MAG TPA: hypothetical protein VG649_25545, partial [Candidatus Angelobacter sp.]|nr:hypothetical protein [Candidatus Angelobacter sp.]